MRLLVPFLFIQPQQQKGGDADLETTKIDYYSYPKEEKK